VTLSLNAVQGMASAIGAPLLPWKVFTPGHSAPLRFLADALNNPGKDVAAWANRSGIKTLTAAILAALEFGRGARLHSRVLAGSEHQADCLYTYWRGYMGSPFLAPLLDGEPKQLLTRCNGGQMEILAASQKRVRGPKVQRLFEDELDEIDPEIDAAAAGMISTRHGNPGRTVYTSTWHHVSGPMAKLVEGCPGNGVSLHRWNIWESLANCPRERHEDGSGCESCPLQSPCVAKARAFHADPDWRVGIASEACGLYLVEDACKAYLKVGKATWDSEYLCLRPSVEGLVYPDFDPMVHGVDAAPDGLTVYRSIDWGLGCFVCLWIGQEHSGRAYVLDCYESREGTIPQHIAFIKRNKLADVKATYCDPAGVSRNDQTGKSNVQVFREAGIPCEYTTAPSLRDVHNGIRLVRDALTPASGSPRLLYVRNAGNRAFERSMQSYRNRKVNNVWIDEPQDPQEFEHVPDALRYFFVNRAAPRGVGVAAYGTH
jgi:hypothetical protein